MLPRLAVTFVLAAFCAIPLRAQTSEVSSDAGAPAHVAHIEGAASLEREGRADNTPLNMPLLSGDRLRTGTDGRVEVLFADGSTLHLDMRSTVDMQSDDLVRLTDGRLRLNVHGPARSVAYRIDSPAGSARITQAGEYRVSLLRGTNDLQLELAVVRGAAEIFTDEGSTPVRAGERAYASAGLAPSYAFTYNSATWDAFDRWSESRRDVRLGVSSQYLPSDMQSYAPVLDQDGDWRYTASYGYAWYPRVESDWRPYYNGRWASYPQYGWTWIGSERFAWPTHHYGRWGIAAGVWFWTPSSRWAPAYVSWGYAPGYVSWCPLGFDNRPVIGIDLYRVGPDYYSPWRAWTAVSTAHFGSRGYYVNQRAVNWDRFDRGQRPRFATRSAAPGDRRDIAVARNSTPIRWAGSRDASTPGDRNGAGGAMAAPPGDGIGRDTSRDASAGDAAQPRSVPPRYVNRGDEIVRSSTERPSPRAGAPGPQPSGAVQGRPAREGYAAPRYTPRPERAAPPSETAGAVDNRTMPATPARRADPGFERAPYAGQARPRVEPAPAADGATGQPFEVSPGASRAYDPRGVRPDARGDRSRPDGPYAAPSAPSREAQPRAYDRPRGSSESAAQPQPERQPATERAAPAEQAPSRGEGRQPPPERAGSAERAAPRAGAAVPRRGGRGGA